MRIFKTAMKIVGVLAFVVVLNSAVSFAFVPYASKCDLTWQEYRQQDDLDLAFVGNSRTAHAFDPGVVGDELGVSAFNTCTQGQLIEESYLAVKKVVDEHHPNTIVFGFDFCDVQGNEFTNPGRAFIKAKDKGDVGCIPFRLRFLLRGRSFLHDEGVHQLAVPLGGQSCEANAWQHHPKHQDENRAAFAGKRHRGVSGRLEALWQGLQQPRPSNELQRG